MSDNEEENSSSSMTKTTVIMTNNVIKTFEKIALDGGGGSDIDQTIRRNGSVRRRLSKQNATIEEPTSSTEHSSTDSPKSEEIPEEDSIVIEEREEEEDEEASLPILGDDIHQRQRLQREDAVVGDDDTKLRPPSLHKKPSWSLSKSLSRESTGTDYSDRSGTDLRQFIRRTMHKSEDDRKQLMEFEKEMIELIEDPEQQSKKYVLPSSYHRMLLHRCAAWFGLDHNVTNKQTEIVVNKSEKTKIPDEKFEDHIINDSFTEENFQPKITKQHGSFNGTQYDSQTSLNNEMLGMRRAQSFDQPAHLHPSQLHHHPPPPLPHPHYGMRCVPMRQLSLQCNQKYVPHPPNHQWITSSPQQQQQQHSPTTYYYTQTPPTGSPRRAPPMMRKAESFGGMEYGYLEGPYVCHTPPIMVQQGYEEWATGSPQPIYQEQHHVMCSPPLPRYEYQPAQHVCIQPVKMVLPPPPPGNYYYSQQRQATSPCMAYHGHHQYMEMQPAHYAPQMVDQIMEQPFPTVEHFNIPHGTPEVQLPSSTHQTETASKFIKASIDGGYGSMNQEVDSSRESDTGVDV